MEAFNFIAGLVGVVGLVFSVYVWMEAKRKEAIETQKSMTFEHRLADMLDVVNAVARQGRLVTMLADREEVTKKELKHLMLAQLESIHAAQDGLGRIRTLESEWEFGTGPAR